MAESEQEIKGKITSYIDRNGGNYPKWYVGITNDLETRLRQHKVKNSDPHTHGTAYTDGAARSVEKYFIEEKHTQGGSGGGDDDSRIVYSYKTAPHTEE